MKSTGFWIVRFCQAAGIVFVLLLAAGLLRGRALETALVQSLLWAVISSAIFTGSRYYQARKGIACALCKDTVEDCPPAAPSPPGVSSDIRTRSQP